MTLCDRKREIFAFGPSVLTYQLSLDHHKQIHANPTVVLERARVSVAQVAALDALAGVNPTQLILYVPLFREWFKVVGFDIPENVNILVRI